MARDKKFKKWRHLANGVAANAGDLPHLETFGQQLTSLLGDAEGTANQQLAFAASKQDASQHLLEIEAVGGRIATLLTAGILQRYGSSSEKLTEFGLQPFRGGRPRAVNPPGPEVAQPDPANDPKK
jgi:hypothetical protein